MLHITNGKKDSNSMRIRTIIITGVTLATLGFVAIAGPANAAVSSTPECEPVKAAAARTETFYKYVPAGKPSDGPTQWDTMNAPSGTHKTWVVRGANVDYVRDGNKTSTVAHPAIEEVTCDATYTVDLPDVFDIEHAGEYPEGTYWATKVTKEFTNSTDVDYVINVMNADVQDGDRVWVERGVFENWYHQIVIPAHTTKTFTFDVWYNAVSEADVPDDLTLTYTVTKNFTWS